MTTQTQVLKQPHSSLSKTKRLTTMALLAAVSVVLILFVRIPIFPAASYLVYDMADVPILLASFLFGPVAGLEVLAVVCAIQGFLLGGDGWVGFLMHFLASATFILVACGFYRLCKQNKKGLIIGLVVATIARAAVMVPLNLIFTVHFYGVPHDVVDAGLIPVTIPFNLLVSGCNSIIFLLLYQSLQFFLKQRQL